MANGAAGAGAGASSSRDWNRSAMIRTEIEGLRPLLRQHQEQRQKLLQELEDARAAEQEAKKAVMLSRLTQQEKRKELRKTLQNAVARVILEQRSMKALATPSPELHVLEEKLNEDLQGLRHKIHGLKYSQEDQDQGASVIQNWWRCILAARVRKLLRISNSMWDLKKKMAKASLTIQRWFRASVVRGKWRCVLETAILRRRKSLEARLEHQTQVVKVLQRAIRIYLAKKRLARNQEIGVELVEDRRFEGSSKYVDNWRPASERRDVRDGMPAEDLELTKMKDAGLIPFYSRTSNTIRHRIGGPCALKIQMQLGIGVGRADPTEVEGKEKLFASVTKAVCAKSLTDSTFPDLDQLGGNWEIYPDGLSQGFLQSLASPRPAKRPDRRPTRRPTKAREVGLLTQRRAEHREQQQQEETAAMIKAEAIKAVAHLQHPLLEGLLPNVPMHVKPAPPSAPPGRTRPNFGCSFRREECSWSDATSFYGSRRSETAREGTSWRHM